MNRAFSLIARLSLLLSLVLAASNSLASSYDEETDGDLSGDYANPTNWNLSVDTNSLIASTGTFDVADLEYVRIDLPASHRLSQIVLQFYEGRDGTGFIGLQSGAAFTFPASEAFSNINNMLGWAHFGPSLGHVNGTDLLPIIGQGGQTFALPLQGSTYTFWIQQTGSVMDFQLKFIVTAVPEPASAALTAIAGFVLCGLRCFRTKRAVSINTR